MRRSSAASMLLSLMEGSTAKSNSSRTVRIATPADAWGDGWYWNTCQRDARPRRLSFLLFFEALLNWRQSDCSRFQIYAPSTQLLPCPHLHTQTYSPFFLAPPLLTVLAEEVVDVLAVLPQEVKSLRVVQIHGLGHVNDVQLALLTISASPVISACCYTCVTDEGISWQTDIRTGDMQYPESHRAPCPTSAPCPSLTL